jgi:hypothetical protein
MGFYEVISYQKYDIWGKLWTLVINQHTRKEALHLPSVTENIM